MSEPLSKVDSAVEGLEQPTSPAKTKRRASSHVEGVFNIDELSMTCHPRLGIPNPADHSSTAAEKRTPIEVAIETQKTGW